MPRARLVLAAVALAMASLSLAADKDVEDLLGHMRDAYKAVKAAKFTVVTSRPDSDGKNQDITTDFLYKPTNMIKFTINGLPGSDGKTATIVTDGKKIGGEGMAEGAEKRDFSFDEIERGMPANLEAMSFWDWDRQLSTKEGANMNKSAFAIVKDEKWDDKSYTVLEETAKEQNVFVRYFIDPTTYFIKRTMVFNLDDKAKPTSDSKITKFETDADISDSEFTVKG